MKISRAVIVLSILAGLFAMVQSAAGLFCQGGTGPFPFATLHGQVVRINGQGIYQYDTYFKAPIFRGTDLLTLCLVIPLLAIALYFYARGSLRGGLLLTGLLSFLLYIAASIALGAAYNQLFLVYLALFSTSFFAFILAFRSIDINALAHGMLPGVPRRGIAVLMFLSGAALLVAWLGEIIGPMMNGGIAAIDSYTTEVTYVLDLGVITPVVLLTGMLILRRAPVGYLLSTILLVMLVLVGLMVSSQTVFQLQAGIDLPVGVFIGKSASFMLLAVFSAGLAVQLVRRVPLTA